MKLSIVIVSWNVKDDLLACLRSIEQNPPSEEFEVIVVDNASTDGSAEAVRNLFPRVMLIPNNQNMGFAAANNVGIKKAQGSYVLLLNPDTIVHDGTLDALIKFMDENKDVGICGPKLLNPDGTTQPSTRRFPTMRGILHHHTIFRFIPVFRGHHRKWLMKDFTHDHQEDVDQVMGAALMARRSVLEELGGMDEAFFMYYEEVDLCYRLKQLGWRIVFTPTARITHNAGRSAAQIPVERRLMKLKSALRFLRKHHPPRSVLLFNILFKPAALLQDIYHILTGLLTIPFALVTADGRKLRQGARKVARSAVFLAKYSWQVLFRI